MESSDLKYLAEEIAKNNAVIFVGAGMSLNAVPANDQVTSKFKDWTSFMLQLAAKLWPDATNDELNRKIGGEFLYVTELYKERFGEALFYKEFLEAVPAQDYLPSDLHRTLFSLPWVEYITTNQDDLIEKTLRQLYIPFHCVIQDVDLSTSLNRRLIKMHGTWDRSDTLVFSEEDYRKYDHKHPLISLKVKQLFAERTVFFVGFGLKDQNFKNIYSWIQDILGNYQKKAYAYMANADEYTKNHWRKRNLVILSDLIHESDPEEWKYSYQKNLSNKIELLNEEIKMVRARKNLGSDIAKNYQRIRPLIFEQEKRREIEQWLTQLTQRRQNF